MSTPFVREAEQCGPPLGGPVHIKTLTRSGSGCLTTKRKKGRMETEGRSIPAAVVMEISWPGMLGPPDSQDCLA